MRTMTSLFLILSLGILLLRAQPAAVQGTADQHWIDRLKKTPVNQIETGLSGANFADWFAERVKPSAPGYEVKECGEHDPTASVNSQRLLCVFAYTIPLQRGWDRGIQLSFVVGVLPPSATGIAEAKPVPCRFLSGSDAPSNPQMKRPTYRFLKLSDFGKRYPAHAPGPNSE